jgi:FAD/FMN-containing dehydrogenase
MLAISKNSVIMNNFTNKLIRLILAIVFFNQLSISYAAVIVNDLKEMNHIKVEKIIQPKSAEEVSKAISEHLGCVSIGGGRYSQGGQIARENCLFLDMRNMKRIINLDIEKRKITVEAGATWRDIQEKIDPQRLSIRIMQSFSNFTVGGSLSVNAHGRYVGEGSIIHSVESIKIVLADGSINKASRTKNPELFFGAIGGYGGLGVIVEATLTLAENTHIERSSKKMSISEYKNYFFNNVKNSKTAVFHNADIYPPHYKQLNSITWNITDKSLTIKQKLASQDELSSFQKILLAWVANDRIGKYFRQYIYDTYESYGRKIVWRNYEASHDVAVVEPLSLSRNKSIYALQEYFIPIDNFNNFSTKMALILNQHHVNVINISIRHALPDSESLLSWARKEVFCFVIYYEQGLNDSDKKEVYKLTSKLIDVALEEGGAYYLPYQIIATSEQFFRAYPKSVEYFALKRRIDPTYKFRNKLWDRYFGKI